MTNITNNCGVSPCRNSDSCGESSGSITTPAGASPANNNQEFIDGLESLLTLLKERRTFPKISSADIVVHANGKEEMAGVMRAMERTEKLPPSYPGDLRFQVRRKFGPVELIGWCYREYVCKKVKVIKEVEEWECPESVLADVPQELQKKSEQFVPHEPRK